jgi:hypothetical protein
MADLSYTYAELAAAMQDWPVTNDPEYIAEIPNMISTGENALVSAMQLQIFEQILCATLTPNDPQIIKPPETTYAVMQALLTMWYNDPNNGNMYTQMVRRHPDWVRAVNGSSSNPTTGSPKYFCEQDTQQWLIAPTPNFSGTMNLDVIARPEMLDEGTPNGYSWMSLHYARLLLLSCLLNAEVYLMNDDRWATIKREYDYLLVYARNETATLRRVGPDDETYGRDIQRASNAEPQPGAT